MSNRIRCAIYTRKSSEDGLEQDFNSLDAQREACEAFIQSQRSLGWTPLPKRYDDGGLSGGTMDRPALQALLVDIDRGKVDLIVVYKVDRLTRSLTDFARIVDTIEARKVSFVSVTQQFNTTTSMGRLTLNVLLSFAQFEREVTAERIRDKIAASKKKGMWMGGLAPLGYDSREKQLFINEREAKTVRTLFRLYLEFGSVRRLKEEADRRGLITKRRKDSNGNLTGGKPFSRGHLYQLLHNPIYIGEIAHKGQTYPGQHKGIVARNTWNAVQRRLDGNSTARNSANNVTQTNLLTGLIYDETGDRLCPTYAIKSNRRYRYYISKRLVHEPNKKNGGWRIPSKELERFVERAVCGFLKDDVHLIDAIRLPTVSTDLIRRALENASELADRISGDDLDAKRRSLRALLRRVTVGKSAIKVEVSRWGLRGSLIGPCDGGANVDGEIISLDAPIEIRRKGIERKIILSSPSDMPTPDDRLIALVAQSRPWFEQMSMGQVSSVREIARKYKLDQGHVSRFLPLAFLAPDIIESILAGNQPSELTAEQFKQIGGIPYSWEEQRQVLGFTS